MTAGYSCLLLVKRKSNPSLPQLSTIGRLPTAARRSAHLCRWSSVASTSPPRLPAPAGGEAQVPRDRAREVCLLVRG